MADVPAMIRRPVPIKKITRRLLAIPVPFHPAPQVGDGLADLALDCVVPVKILPRSQQSLHEKCGLHQVAAVVVFAEIIGDLARYPVEKMRPSTMETVRLAQKARDFEQAFRAL